MQVSERFCEEINRRLNSLSYKFKDIPERQTLCVHSYEPIYFSPKAGGTVQGGSRQWMLNKHKSGQVHEPGMIAVVETILTLSNTVNNLFDIGALYGYFSLLFLSVSRSANVYSFEMNPKSFAAMQKNVACNQHLDTSRIHLVNCAFSDSSENARKSVVQNFSLKSYSDLNFKDRLKFLVGQGKSTVKSLLTGKQYQGAISENIDFWSVDDWCKSKDVLPDLMKIDVEGYQAKIIPGAMETIKMSKPFILLEFDSPSAGNSFGLSNKEIVKSLFEQGYKLIWGKHRTHDGVFKPLTYDELNSSHECNSLGLFFLESKLNEVDF